MNEKKLKVIGGLVAAGSFVGTVASIVGVEGSWQKPLAVTVCILLLVIAVVAFWKAPLLQLVPALMAMRRCGIVSIDRSGDSGPEMEEALGQATSIKVMATTAIHFLTAYRGHLVDALVKRRATITFLLAESSSQFVKDLDEIEEQRGQGSLGRELENVHKEIRVLTKEARQKAPNDETIGTVKLGHFSTLLRNTFILCSNSECDTKLGWLTMTLPPKRCMERGSISFLIRQGDLFDACTDSFDRTAAIADARGALETCGVTVHGVVGGNPGRKPGDTQDSHQL